MMYDPVHLDALRRRVAETLPRWGFSPAARVFLLSASENATFLAEEDGVRRVVRVHRPGYHTDAEIRSELAWIAALRRDGVVPIPAPVPTVTGETLAWLHPPGPPRRAVAFEFMGGTEPDADTDGVFWFRHLGGITARLHRHARSWSRPPGFVRKRWDFAAILGEAALWGDWRQAVGLDEAGCAVLERLVVRLRMETAAFGCTPDRFGLVHGDLRAANLLVDGGRMGVIDFDDCGLCWFGFDFAAAVSFIEHEPAVPALMAAWLAGYRTVAPFPEEQERALPVFVMLRRMQLTAWVASHAETPTAQALGAGYTRGTAALAEAYLCTRAITP